jgi:hypothetical protein
MTADKIELELIQGVTRNANVREFAKPRRNAVNDGIARYDFFDNFARCQNARLRESGNFDGLPIVRYGGDLRKRNAFTLQLHSRSLAGKTEDGKRWARVPYVLWLYASICLAPKAQYSGQPGQRRPMKLVHEKTAAL